MPLTGSPKSGTSCAENMAMTHNRRTEAFTRRDLVVVIAVIFVTDRFARRKRCIRLEIARARAISSWATGDVQQTTSGNLYGNCVKNALVEKAGNDKVTNLTWIRLVFP